MGGGQLDEQDVVTTSKGVGSCLERRGSDPCCTMDVPWGCVCEHSRLRGTLLWDSAYGRSLESKPRAGRGWAWWGVGGVPWGRALLWKDEKVMEMMVWCVHELKPAELCM